jgi:hypothetical protein
MPNFELESSSQGCVPSVLGAAGKARQKLYLALHGLLARHGICRHLRHVEVMPSYWLSARDASLSHQDVLTREKLMEQKGKTIPHRGFPCGHPPEY